MFDLEENKNVLWGVLAVTAITIVFGVAMVSNESDQNSNTSTKDVNIEVTEDDWSKGADEPKVTLVEYGDFQCPACGAYFPLVQRLNSEFGKDLEIVFRHYPLMQAHPNAMPAAKAAEAAGEQEKFWEMHDKLFENQQDWNKASNPLDNFKTYASEIGLDVNQFEEDFDSDEVGDRVREDISSAGEIGISGTPSFIINGKLIESLPKNYEDFKKLIQDEINDRGSDSNTTSTAVHKHADIAMYVNGRQVNLGADKYQSTEENPKHKYVHLHDGNGEVVHQHKKGVTLGEFFQSIGMQLNDECLILDNGVKYCNTENNSLKFFVNGERKTSYGQYEFKDLDQILISYGPKAGPNLKQQLDSITDRACIYSKECPDRGTPPKESCVGGLGTACNQDSNHSHSTSSQS